MWSNDIELIISQGCCRDGGRSVHDQEPVAKHHAVAGTRKHLKERWLGCYCCRGVRRHARTTISGCTWADSSSSQSKAQVLLWWLSTAGHTARNQISPLSVRLLNEGHLKITSAGYWFSSDLSHVGVVCTMTSTKSSLLLYCLLLLGCVSLPRKFFFQSWSFWSSFQFFILQ